MKLFKKTTAQTEQQTEQPTSDETRHETMQTSCVEKRKTYEQAEQERWEQRRWELTRYLVSQDRRSVVLGKLNLSDAAIARRARQLADATIEELRSNKMQHGQGKGSK